MQYFNTSPPIITAVENWGKMCYLISSENGQIEIGGVMKPLLDLLEEKIGFKYQLVRSPENTWGSLKSDGNFSGMFGMVQRKEVDMILGPSTISYDRAQIADFAFIVLYDTSRIVYRKPDDLDNFWAFLQPFTAQIWLLILLSMATFTLALYGLITISQLIRGQDKRLNLGDCLHVCMMYFSLQGSGYHPRSSVLRWNVLVWSIATLVIAKSYEGTLTAIMSIPLERIPIKSQQDILDTRLMPWRVEIESTLYDQFKYSDKPKAMEIFRGLAGTFIDCHNNRSQISDGKFIAFCDRNTAITARDWHFRRSRRCDLYIAPEVLLTMPMTLAFVKDHPMLPIFNYWLHRIFEHGIMQYFQKSYLTRDFCKDSAVTIPRGHKRVTVESVSGFFTVLLIGHLGAIGVFAIEIIAGKATLKQRRDVTQDKTKRYSVNE